MSKSVQEAVRAIMAVVQSETADMTPVDKGMVLDTVANQIDGIDVGGDDEDEDLDDDDDDEEEDDDDFGDEDDLDLDDEDDEN